jgi:hypothetical protein
MAETSGANRIELECQVLSAALRASWQCEDGSGRAKSCLELAQLFPDLVTPFDASPRQAPRNNYALLDIACDVTPRKVIIAYFRKAKMFLRENNPRQKRLDYFQLLDAGFVLRKPRLRLSHDLVVSRAELIDRKLIQANGTFEMLEMPAMAQAAAQPSALSAADVASSGAPSATEAASNAASAAAEAAAAASAAAASAAAAASSSAQAASSSAQAASAPGSSGSGAPPLGTADSGVGAPPVPLTPGQTSSQPPFPGQVAPGPASPAQSAASIRLPAVVELLRAAQLIAGPEVQALTNQMRSFPGVSVVELILSAGYVTESEMKSVQLGEFLLGQGKINLGQFCVAMYDERSTGVKMAESLQARGWLKAD